MLVKITYMIKMLMHLAFNISLRVYLILIE
jgi:hypothetical protein